MGLSEWFHSVIREFRQQEDTSLFILSKQSESTKVGLSGPEERKRQKELAFLRRAAAARRQARHSFKSAGIISNICKKLTKSGHLCMSKLNQK